MDRLNPIDKTKVEFRKADFQTRFTKKTHVAKQIFKQDAKKTNFAKQIFKHIDKTKSNFAKQIFKQY